MVTWVEKGNLKTQIILNRKKCSSSPHRHYATHIHVAMWRTAMAREEQILIKVIIAVFILVPIVGFLAMASEDPGSLPAVPMFLSILIIVATGIIIDKINKLTEKNELLSSKLDETETKDVTDGGGDEI